MLCALLQKLGVPLARKKDAVAEESNSDGDSAVGSKKKQSNCRKLKASKRCDRLELFIHVANM